MAQTNWELGEMTSGTEMWKKYKQSTELRYHMSQTDIFLNSLKAKLHVQNTIIAPDDIQPPREELLALNQTGTNNPSNLMAPRRGGSKKKKKNVTTKTSPESV